MAEQLYYEGPTIIPPPLGSITPKTALTMLELEYMFKSHEHDGPLRDLAYEALGITREQVYKVVNSYTEVEMYGANGMRMNGDGLAVCYRRWKQVGHNFNENDRSTVWQVVPYPDNDDNCLVRIAPEHPMMQYLGIKWLRDGMLVCRRQKIKRLVQDGVLEKLPDNMVGESKLPQSIDWEDIIRKSGNYPPKEDTNSNVREVEWQFVVLTGLDIPIETEEGTRKQESIPANTQITIAIKWRLCEVPEGTYEGAGMLGGHPSHDPNIVRKGTITIHGKDVVKDRIIENVLLPEINGRRIAIIDGENEKKVRVTTSTFAPDYIDS